MINSFPDSLNKLAFTNVIFDDSDTIAITLPIHLHTLFIDANSDCNDFTTFQISNSNQLNEFTDLELILHNPMCSNTELRRFIHSFADNMRSFSLHSYTTDGYENLDLLLPVALELAKLTNLKDVSYSTNDLTNSVDISHLPPCVNLEFGSFHQSDTPFIFPTVSGQFPLTLESLRVDLSNYFEPFHDFWKAFVSPLKNLLSFSALIRDDQDIDFKGLSFPKHLHTIELLGENNNNMRLLFEQVPESLIHFGYNFHRFRSTEPVKVIIEKHNDELSLELVEKVFGGHAVYEFEWADGN
ncbi:unnamed protein product [Ambrosiozyma monospora]|uniref:Unnamed protein product n=1 Tax=Ambrosiozyma monospora TaxID=43982 RepID=A0ACB5TVQ6_AMBMO|nr:unnamed protein product [Ambrosiozyma monospora]